MQDHQSASPPDLTQSNQKPPRSISLGLVAGLAAVGLITGGGVAWWAWQTTAPIAPLPAPVTSQPSTPASPQALVEKTVQIYWLKSVGNQVQLAATPVNLKAEQPNDLLKGALEQVLDQPVDPTLASAIPINTTLRNLEVKSDGIHIDLSPEFMAGGGSTAMMGRLGQVIYTATTLDPTAKVWISVEGKPLEVLGGEGLLVEQPMTRDRFQQDFQL
ncbi:MAG: spore germination protein [Leptolyngbyaceae cyanobacterium CRU_2_3]|nr:spore germination protein [Leptolyngbyaceae cyanobacterium CRU_2_3]